MKYIVIGASVEGMIAAKALGCPLVDSRRHDEFTLTARLPLVAGNRQTLDQFGIKSIREDFSQGLRMNGWISSNHREASPAHRNQFGLKTVGRIGDRFVRDFVELGSHESIYRSSAFLESDLLSEFSNKAVWGMSIEEALGVATEEGRHVVFAGELPDLMKARPTGKSYDLGSTPILRHITPLNIKSRAACRILNCDLDSPIISASIFDRHLIVDQTVQFQPHNETLTIECLEDLGLLPSHIEKGSANVQHIKHGYIAGLGSSDKEHLVKTYESFGITLLNNSARWSQMNFHGVTMVINDLMKRQ